MKINSLIIGSVSAAFTSWWLIQLLLSWQAPQDVGVGNLQHEDTGADLACNHNRVVRETSLRCSHLAGHESVRTAPSIGPTTKTDHIAGVAIKKSFGAKDVEALGQRIRLEYANAIDLYDPATWPKEEPVEDDNAPTPTIDPYDPNSWPLKINQDVEPAPIDPVDPYDPATWPTDDPAAPLRDISLADMGDITMDIYDHSTWPGYGSMQTSAEYTEAINPYDPESWPDR